MVIALKSCLYIQVKPVVKMKVKYYCSTTKNEFKFRYNNHEKSLTHSYYEKQTNFLEYIWKLK